jgi:hypothetical protein
MRRIAALAALLALLGESPALAESCKVRNGRSAGNWIFVQVYDVDKGQVVLRQAINGGDSKDVTVSGHRARVDQKPAGHRNYKAGAVAACKGGNTISF